MGVTVHYRGKIDELDRVEDFEDRVIDLVLLLGGNVRVWRSADDADPTRVIRGLIVDLWPGQETTSFLISPEGKFITLLEIEDAEQGPLEESSWCWVKTQFGSVEGHVALVELLTAIKQEFASNLEVRDEGDYWETRDVARLSQKMGFLKAAIDGLAEALRNDHLSPEAAEDPEILATRVERLAKIVHAKLRRPSEHAPREFLDDNLGLPTDPAANEAHWDGLFQDNRRKQERMERAIEERRLRGEEIEEAFRGALDDVQPDMELLEDDTDDFDSDEPFGASGWQPADDEDDDDEEEFEDSGVESDDVIFGKADANKLRDRAKELYFQFTTYAQGLPRRSPALDQLLRSCGDILGGLAQALPLQAPLDRDDITVGLALVQLKRALRGAAFAQGSLFSLRHDKLLTREQLQEYADSLTNLGKQIAEQIRALRQGTVADDDSDPSGAT